LRLPAPPCASLFPYTTLFRSLAVKEPAVQVQLLVWIFAMRIMMVVASGVSYLINGAIAKSRYQNVDKMNFEAPLTFLVWLTSIRSEEHTSELQSRSDLVCRLL